MDADSQLNNLKILLAKFNETSKCIQALCDSVNGSCNNGDRHRISTESMVLVDARNDSNAVDIPANDFNSSECIVPINIENGQSEDICAWNGSNGVNSENGQNQHLHAWNESNSVETPAFESNRKEYNFAIYSYNCNRQMVLMDAWNDRPVNEVNCKECNALMINENGRVRKPLDVFDYGLNSSDKNKIRTLEMSKVVEDQNDSDVDIESIENVLLPVGMWDYNLNSGAGIDIDEQMQIDDESNENAAITIGTTNTNTADVDADTLQKSFGKINVIPRQGCDNSKMYVPTSDLGRNTKKLCCVYCLKRYPKLARHLITVHKDEEDVKKIRALPVGSKKRRLCIDKLRNLGRFEWNENGDINGGELSTSRRPNKKFARNPFGYLTCANCFALIRKTVLRHHWNTCTNRSFAGERIVKQLGCAVEGRLHVDACDELRLTIFPKMNGDEVAMSIRFDWIVITYGNDLCTNYDQLAMIGNKLKNAGKVLLASRSICPGVTDFASLYDVKNCNTVIGAIRTIAGYNSELKTFRAPGTAAALVTLMNTIGDFLSIEYIKLGDEAKETAVNRFLKVFKKEVKTKINKTVAVTQLAVKRGKHENIPSTADVRKLVEYLDRERDSCFSELSKEYSDEKWLELAELTFMSVLIFNRKRVGDMQNIDLSYFEGREMVAERVDSLLSEETKEMIKSRLKIRGKLYRTVPVLLKHSFDACLALLIHYRQEAGVPDNNKLLFGLPNKIGEVKRINGCALFRKFSVACGAKNPSSLRGTNLRKHFASMCSTMNLKDSDVSNVAKFMGHSDKIHREVYQHIPDDHQLTQMAALLEVAQGSNTITVPEFGSSIIPTNNTIPKVASTIHRNSIKRIRVVTNNTASRVRYIVRSSVKAATTNSKIVRVRSTVRSLVKRVKPIAAGSSPLRHITANATGAKVGSSEPLKPATTNNKVEGIGSRVKPLVKRVKPIAAGSSPLRHINAYATGPKVGSLKPLTPATTNNKVERIGSRVKPLVKRVKPITAGSSPLRHINANATAPNVVSKNETRNEKISD